MTLGFLDKRSQWGYWMPESLIPLTPAGAKPVTTFREVIGGCPHEGVVLSRCWFMILNGPYRKEAKSAFVGEQIQIYLTKICLLLLSMKYNSYL